jgi:cell division protein FtsZ
VMKNSGVALMGSAKASGPTRDMDAIKIALESPLLKDNDIRGSKNILLNIMSEKGDNELTMSEFGSITKYLKEVVGKDANVIWGTGHDETLGDSISVTIIATGFETYPGLYEKDEKKKEVIRIKFGETLEVVKDDIEENYDEFFPIDSAAADENIIELESDFDRTPAENDEDNIILPDMDKSHFEHVKDINKLNDSMTLDQLENQPAIARRKFETEDDINNEKD